MVNSMFGKDNFVELQLKMNKTQAEMNKSFVKQLELLTDLAAYQGNEMQKMADRINELEVKLENKKEF